MLKSPVTINFDDNIARTDGAALNFGEYDAYIYRCYSLPLCILKAEVTNSSTLEDIYLNFTNNYSFDNHTNTAVFGGDLEHCEMQMNDKSLQSNGFQFLKNVSTFTPGGIKGSISSQAMKVCFCKNGTPDCNGESSKDISIVPGRLFSPLSIFIAWFNLDFGIPTCFYDGLDAYWYAWLQYAFPLYLWLLIGIILCATNCSVRVGRLLGSNPVAVLATVVLMSYTKLLQTTVGALRFKTLKYHGSRHSFYSDGLRVWLFDGNITYFEGKHIILDTFGICFLSFLILPYIFLLLFGYRLQAYSGRKGFIWFNKFKPILDAYYAPYNSKNRYWPGFMLLVRGGVFLSSILIYDTTNLLVVSSLFMAIGLIPWLRYPLYEKLYLDLLEASFILNIGILASATHHVKMVDGNQAPVTYMSVAVALAEFLGILIFRLCICIKNATCFQEWGCVKWFGRVFESRRKRATYQLLNDTAAAAPNMPPTRTFVDIREVLLEDN